MESAEVQKELGNQLFKDGKFFEAMTHYNKAISIDNQNPVYFANRSFCFYKLEEFGSSLQDATKAIEIDINYVKAYYRRGCAQASLFKFKEAIADFKKCVQLAPGDKNARQKLEEIKKEKRILDFENAIAREEEKPIDLSSIEVSDTYKGLTLSEDGLTHEQCVQLVENFKKGITLHKKYALQLIFKVKQQLEKLDSLIHIQAPNGITVCGDTHGQFYDYCEIYRLNGYPSQTNPYIFNGDFTDRGSYAVEIILTILAFKVLYPNYVHLTRGNHESRQMNMIYGFEGEVTAKYDRNMYDVFKTFFHYLPLAICINNQVLVLHGGLFGRDDVTLEDIRKINRVCEPPETGLMNDILWSDPQKTPGRSPSKRGTGIQFGPDVAHRFLDQNGLKLLIRSHEVKQEGYEVEADGRVITVFSAPKYCGQMDNKGAFIKLDANMKPSFVQFESVYVPGLKPAMAYAKPYAFFWNSFLLKLKHLAYIIFIGLMLIVMIRHLSSIFQRLGKY